MFINELNKVKSIIQQQRNKGKTINPKHLLQITMQNSTKDDLIIINERLNQAVFNEDVLEIELLVLCIKCVGCGIQDQNLIYTTFDYLMISNNNTRIAKKLLSQLSQEQQIGLIDNYIGGQGLQKRTIVALYESIMSTHDETMHIADNIKQLYRNIYSLINEPALQEYTLNQMFGYFKLNDEVFSDKHQQFVAEQLKEIRQIMFGWIVTAIRVPTTHKLLLQGIPLLFTQSVQMNPDLKLTPPELIKLVLIAHLGDLSKSPVLELPLFWEALKDSFNTFNDLTNSKICVSILHQILVLVDDQNKYFSLFADLYTTLDSFGTHITKDVWPKMDPFLVAQQFNIDSPIKENLHKAIKPIDILLRKAENHTNEKTLKNCIKALFKKQVDFTYLKNLVIDLVVPILNRPIFYQDSPLEGDSKFNILVQQFFSKIPYMDEVIVQVTKHIKYQLAMGAFAVTLSNVDTPINEHTLELMVNYMGENVMGLNLRKRMYLIQATIQLFKHNTNPQLIWNLFNKLPFECLKWQCHGDPIRIVDGLRQIVDRELKQINDVILAQPKNIDTLKPLCMLAIVNDKLNYEQLFTQVFQGASKLYSSTYAQQDDKLDQIELLNTLLRYGANFNQSGLVYLYQQLDNISSELFGFLSIRLDVATQIVESIWTIGLLNLNQSSQLAQGMSKFVGSLFKQWYDQTNQLVILELLCIMLKVTNQTIITAKQNKTGVFIEELFLKYGLELLEQLQSKPLERSFKNLYLQYLSHIMTLCREVGHRNEQYENQVKLLLQNVSEIADQFNAYDSLVLYQLLKRVYTPEICMHGVSHLDEFRNVALNSYSSMMAVFGTHTNVDEFLAYIDFIIDPLLFGSELCETVVHVLGEIMDMNQKSWIMHRKMINNLVCCLSQHPNRLPIFQALLLKLIRGNEVRGYDTSVILSNQEQYVPYTNKVKDRLGCKGEFYGAYPRFLVLELLQDIANQEIYQNELIGLVKYLIDSSSSEQYKQGYMQYTNEFRMKLHAWQCVSSLKRIFKDFKGDRKVLVDLEQSIWKAFDQQNHPAYRQYIEMMILYMMEMYPDIWGPRILACLNDTKVKVNIQIPTVFISCVYLHHQPQHELTSQLFHKIFPMVSSNVAYIRSLCQTCCLKYIKQNKTINQSQYIIEFIKFFESNRECIKIIKNIEGLINRYDNLLQQFDMDGLYALQFDTFGEIIHPSIIDTLKSVCIQTISEIKVEDGLDQKIEPHWHQYVTNQGLQPQESKTLQFQRKIDFIMDQFDLFKAFRPRQLVGDLIVVATLLEKIPNFGHLTRTCEIFGCRELVIPSKKILSEEGFTSVSVSAEQHLPISEVKEEYLMNYLLLKKSQGYQLTALEQTSQSKQIMDYKFNQKTILLLGREKTGVPLEYIELMDACVEIPQFGVIRSLNVHVSAVICVWQYVQQHSQ